MNTTTVFTDYSIDHIERKVEYILRNQCSIKRVICRHAKKKIIKNK